VALATGKNWFKVPATDRIIVKGKVPKGVFAKDIILSIIGALGANGATYKAVEFSGPVIDGLDMDGRMTICNMVVEMGAKAGFMPCDAKTRGWYAKRLPKGKKLPAIFADRDAVYEKFLEFDVSKLVPTVSVPHNVDTVKPVNELKTVRIDEAFLGTCTNGRLADLTVAAEVLKDRKIAAGVRLIVAAASRQIFQQALARGLIDTFVKAGAAVVVPGCGPCVGTHNGVPADNERVISTANRNFKGRMGNPNAFIYLASPATVAASAIEGRIADPRKYL
jgi:3-isopropylmalate/(R)-2-methylmalate dehydratase large subunit